MTIRELVSDYKGELQDGICWVAIWKKGRTWCAECFWEKSGSYDEGYVFSKEDCETMECILMVDSKAIMLNGYYTNCGVAEDGTATTEDIKNGIEWNYYERHNQLWDFYESWVVKD